MSIKQKKGISLIVLVITIIVMIILATAIILSLNGSGIIGKAREAKIASDNATKEEAVSLKLAEYQLGVQTGEIDSTTTARVWVKEELEKDGIDTSDIAILDNGEVEVGLSPVAVKFVEANVQIGDTVEGYDLSSNTTTTYTTDGKENTYSMNNYKETDPQPQTLERGTDLTWKYMGIDGNGNALILADGSLTKMLLSGKGGWFFGLETLDIVCSVLYSSDMGTARSIDYEDVIGLLKYDGPQGRYWTKTGSIKYTDEALTIGEIEGILGVTMGTRQTPDGKDISNYKANHVQISKTSENIKADDVAKEMVFQTSNYFLAHLFVDAEFVNDYANFELGVMESSIKGRTVFTSRGGTNYVRDCFRPVVILADNVKVSYDGTTVTLSK